MKYFTLNLIKFITALPFLPLYFIKITLVMLLVITLDRKSSSLLWPWEWEWRL